MNYKYLSELSDIRQGRHFYPAGSSDSKEYFLIKSGNIVRGVHRPVPPFTPISIEENIKIFPLRENDILLCHMGTHSGKTAICYKIGNENYVCNQTICVIRSLQVDPVYLFTYLNTYSLSEYIKSRSTRPGNSSYIPKKSIQNIPILIPSKQIQTEIASKTITYMHLQRKSIGLKGELESQIIQLIQGGNQDEPNRSD